jgi:translation initiation factor 3 subunit L
MDTIIKDYIFDLHQASRAKLSKVQSEVDALYGAKFQDLCKNYYGDKSSWPAAASIASLAPALKGSDADDLFLSFYTEMTYRHLFSNGRPVAQDMIDAWSNYCVLFNFIIEAQDVDMLINEQWAFDIIHEFVYQFQSFCQFRSDLTRRSAEDIAVLRGNPDVWNLSAVALYLRRLVRVSNVEAVLVTQRAKGVASQLINVSEQSTPSKMHFDFGYFALFGLSRLECLLGDYHSSIAWLAPVDMCGEKEYFHKVFGCHLQLFYHAGFAFLMMRRYRDSISVLGNMVSFVNRIAKTGQLPRLSGGDEQMAKKTADRMSTLLAIAVALSPGAKVGDVLHGMSAESSRQFVDRKNTLAAATDGSEFEQFFEKACPKFINASAPDYEQHANFSHEPVRRQVELFSKQCSQHLGLSKIRSFLKLYKAIEVEKLAKFHGSSPDDFRAELLAAKHLMAQMHSKLGFGALRGQVKSVLDVHFFVRDGMVQIEDGVADKEMRHESFFMNEILKAEIVE